MCNHGKIAAVYAPSATLSRHKILAVQSSLCLKICLSNGRDYCRDAQQLNWMDLTT